MKQKPNKKAIGLFFTVGLIIFILVVGKALWMRLGYQDSYKAVMYFDESTQGLHEGSPVVFNGVEMGKVVQISLEADPKTFEFKIPVYVELRPINTMDNQGWLKFLNNKWDTLHRMIELGLRARLKMQNFLTGQLMIELSIDKNAPLNMVHTFEEQQEMSIPEIPTVMSPSGKLSKGLDEIQFQNTFLKINDIVITLEKKLPLILDSLTKSAKNMENITRVVSNESLDKMNNTLTEISGAMRSLRNLTDYLEQYPESLLKGKK